MAKFRMEIVERVVFDLEVEADDIIDALAVGREKFKQSGPILEEGGDFMGGKCVAREVRYHYEVEEADG